MGAIAILCATAFAIAAVATPSVSHAQLEPGSPWPMFLYDTGHTGLSTVNICATSGSGEWQSTTSNWGIFTSVAIGADGTIYLANYDLYAFYPDGTEKWEFTFGSGDGDTESSPAIGADGTIYVGSLNGNLYAVTDCTGAGTPIAACSGAGTAAEKWEFPTGDWVESSPAIGADGTIYVGSNDGNLYAVNSDGSQKWAFATAPSRVFPYINSVESSPAIGTDGTIYLASDDGNLYAIADCTGVGAPIAACSGAGTAAKKWAFPIGADFCSSPAIGANGTIYFSSWVNGYVYALTDNGTSVTRNWRSLLETSSSSPAIGADGTIYVGSDDNGLHAINANGTKKWTFTTGGPVNTSAAIGGDGTIYFGSDDGNLYALADGGQGKVTQMWAFPNGTGDWMLSSPAIGADGTIYFGAGDTLYAQPWRPSAPASIAFGSSAVGDIVTKTFTLKNTSAINPLSIGSVTSSDPAEFAETGTTCQAGGLAPGLTCTITIGFTPGALGARSATLTLIDSITTCPQSVELSGTGTIAMTVTPTSYAFGEVKDGSTANKIIAVHNYQTNSVSLNESFSGPNSGDFSIIPGGSCSSMLAAKTACTLNVRLAPTAVGTEGATMTVTDSPDTLGPYTVSFTSGETVPESLSAKKLSFGNVAQTASRTVTIMVTNNATGGPITLTGTTFGGANPNDFSISGSSTCGGLLASSSKCTYAVTFTPSTETAESGTLSIAVAEDPNGGPPAVTLAGTGVTPLKVAPASLSLGTVKVGKTSAAKTVTVTNNGTAPLTISEGITVTTGNSGDFAVSGGTCGTTLAGGGASCTYKATFTPSIVGEESAMLAVSAGATDAASPHNVSLSGTGD
jgi:outer membrane protein assembly factor BamB